MNPNNERTFHDVATMHRNQMSLPDFSEVMNSSAVGKFFRDHNVIFIIFKRFRNKFKGQKVID